MKKRNTKEVILVVATVIAAIVIGSGCTHTWNYPPLKMDDQYRDIAYKYYVIDAHADVPDAFFETYEEASTYQKDFAEHHEYVIVKIGYELLLLRDKVQEETRRRMKVYDDEGKEIKI